MSQEFLVVSRLKWWAVVTNDLLWKTVSCKNVAHSFGGCFCGGGTNHFRPLRVSINYNEIVVGLVGGKVYVYTPP